MTFIIGDRVRTRSIDSVDESFWGKTGTIVDTPPEGRRDSHGYYVDFDHIDNDGPHDNGGLWFDSMLESIKPAHFQKGDRIRFSDRHDPSFYTASKLKVGDVVTVTDVVLGSAAGSGIGYRIDDDSENVGNLWDSTWFESKVVKPSKREKIAELEAEVATLRTENDRLRFSISQADRRVNDLNQEVGDLQEALISARQIAHAVRQQAAAARAANTARVSQLTEESKGALVVGDVLLYAYLELLTAEQQHHLDGYWTGLEDGLSS